MMKKIQQVKDKFKQFFQKSCVNCNNGEHEQCFMSYPWCGCMCNSSKQGLRSLK